MGGALIAPPGRKTILLTYSTRAEEIKRLSVKCCESTNPVAVILVGAVADVAIGRI